MEGCRRIIDFDGCFIAWAVVDSETKHSWSFFINYLKEDLQLGTGDGLTVMADMQKGFHAAVEELLPDTEHRRRARHVWSNWHQEWKGEERRKQFWRCSKAIFEVKFRSELDKMSKLGNDNCDDLLHYPEKSWVRAHFKEHSKCDVVENNMCETFNSWILSCRHKLIITMLEEIRRKIMTRQCDMIKFANTWISEISPMARLTLEDNKEMARGCKVLWNADVGFEIGEELEPEHFVEHWYRKDTFLKAYSYFIQPIPNMKMWPETNNPKIEPPTPKPMPGRPKKKRTKGKDEPKKMRYGKVSRKGGKRTCSKCHQQGHNKKYYKVQKHLAKVYNTLQKHLAKLHLQA
ncbi:uncharacterized protein LOC132611661 [Lycium barbarum]|uniref:uncharacterized protein LOC132611661 n=1 Tax=Lycium barbarum TaxID=112863 RepID=UPI00293ECE25|nr:uncharacterized protein LOC132611661 [Lycium barbarum]